LLASKRWPVADKPQRETKAFFHEDFGAKARLMGTHQWPLLKYVLTAASWGLAMAAYESESVVQFASAAKSTTVRLDQLDSAGQTILQLLNKAANVAEQNSKHAIDMAQKLAHELRAAQQRISELEAEVGAYQNQAERAEQWLHKVYTEIEDRFLQQGRSRARNAAQ
jgi:methylthioribose-1-phosphate isomerase